VHIAKLADSRLQVVKTSKNNEQSLKEAKFLMHVDHINCISLSAAWLSNGFVHMMMPYAEDGILFDIITLEGYVADVKQVSNWMSQLLHAVEYLHSKGIAHNDIKPENIGFFKEEKGIVLKIFDFGLARHVAAGGNVKCGTEDYMAPEMMKIFQPFTLLSDIYSVGVVCCAMLFSRVLPTKKGQLFVYDALDTYRSSNPHLQIPDNLFCLMKSLLSFSPLERPTAAEALEWVGQEKLLCAISPVERPSAFEGLECAEQEKMFVPNKEGIQQKHAKHQRIKEEMLIDFKTSAATELHDALNCAETRPLPIQPNCVQSRVDTDATMAPESA
jgi:serine/threonine protein kinase